MHRLLEAEKAGKQISTVMLQLFIEIYLFADGVDLETFSHRLGAGLVEWHGRGSLDLTFKGCSLLLHQLHPEFTVPSCLN